MQALTGIRVLELGSTVAGPFCGRLLADFGADVVKVEPPGGDALRSMGKHVGSKSLYAASILRNKRLIVVDLSKNEGRDVIKRLISGFDIVIENFRPGTMEKWGLGYDELHAIHPGLIMVRISGFGQDGPYRERPGYGFLGDAVSGLLGITGYPDRPPVRAAVPVTDMVTALYSAYGAAMALVVRAKTGKGQCIDAALYESSFSLMESHVPAFEKLGELPTRSGSRLPGSTPNSLYETKDGAMVAIAAASNAVFTRLAAAMDQPALAQDPRFADAIDRVKNEDAVDAIIGSWTRSLALDEIERRLHAASVPASRVFTLRDIFENEHYRARNMLPQIADEDLGMVTMVGPVPKLSETPGEIRWSGRHIGEDTQAVLAEAGFASGEIQALETTGAIRCRQENTPADGPTRAKFIATTVGAFASIAFIRARADAAEFEFKFAHNVPADHPFNVAMVQMWSTIGRETNGRIKMRLFPQNQLGGDPQTLTQLRTGAIEFAALSGAITSSISSVGQIENLPYAYKNDQVFFNAMDGKLGEYIRKEMEPKGLVALPRMFYKGFRQVTSGTHPIRTAADFGGFTIRTPPTAIFVDCFKALGASPVPTSLGELYPALQTHAVDGEENSYSQIELNHYYEVQKYLSVTNHVTSGLWILANPDVWHKLPDDIKTSIVRNVEKFVGPQRRQMIEVEAAYGDKLSRQGLKFNKPDIASFMPRLTSFYAHWRSEFGATAWSLLESYTGKLG